MERPHAPIDAYSGGSVRLAFGEAADGRIVHIGEVRSGLRCGCICPHCRGALVARRGPLREHHFGHRAGTACVFAAETALHKLAKQVLARVGRLMLPPAVAEVGDLRTEVAPAREVAVDAVAIECRLEAVVPDVVRTAPRRWLHNARIQRVREALEIADRRCDLRRRDLRAMQVDAVIAALERRGGGFAEAPAAYGGNTLADAVIAGDDSLGVGRRAWQGAILRAFVLPALAAPDYAFAAFSTRDVLDRLCQSGIVDPALAGYIDDAMVEEIRRRIPSFASPFRLVEAYLGFLERAELVVRLSRGWSVSRAARRHAARIAKAAASPRANE